MLNYDVRRYYWSKVIFGYRVLPAFQNFQSAGNDITRRPAQKVWLTASARNTRSEFDGNNFVTAPLSIMTNVVPQQ